MDGKCLPAVQSIDRSTPLFLQCCVSGAPESNQIIPATQNAFVFPELPACLPDSLAMASLQHRPRPRGLAVEVDSSSPSRSPSPFPSSSAFCSPTINPSVVISQAGHALSNQCPESHPVGINFPLTNDHRSCAAFSTSRSTSSPSVLLFFLPSRLRSCSFINEDARVAAMLILGSVTCTSTGLL